MGKKHYSRAINCMIMNIIYNCNTLYYNSNMSSTKKTKMISLRLPPKLSQKLRKYCQKNNLPASLVIRRWLIEKLKYIR